MGTEQTHSRMLLIFGEGKREKEQGICVEKFQLHNFFFLRKKLAGTNIAKCY